MSWLSKAAGRIGGAAKSIGGGLVNEVNGIGNLVGGAINGRSSQMSGGLGQIGSGAWNAAGFGAIGLQNPFQGGGGPSAPGVNTDLNNLKNSQQKYAQEFRSQLPQIQSQMQGQLVKDTGQAMQENLRGTRTSNSARGLLYGGVNAGQEGQVRSGAQKGLMSGLSDINTGLRSAADQMDASATQTGLNIQQQQQSMQNQIYSNAMADMNSKNSMFGSAASTGLLAYLAANPAVLAAV